MNKERLKLLADHLRTLPDELWDYRKYVQRQTDCGTVGCALGHCPDLWPNDWVISKSGCLYAIGADLSNDCFVILDAADWFDISPDTASDIFSDPSYYNPEWHNSITVDAAKVTKTMVADAIDKLIMETANE